MTRITSVIRGARKLVTDNSPAILTAVAVVGVATTAFLAAKATPQAMEDIKQAETEQGEPLTVNQKIYLVGYHYVPAVVSGTMTIACIIGVSYIHHQRHAALISAYTLSEKVIQEYQEKVKENLGEGKERKVRDDIAQDTVNANPPSSEKIFITGHGDHMFLDKMSGRYFRSTVDKVRKAENKLVHQLNNDAYASLNDFYGYLNIPASDIGEELGWQSDNIVEVLFSTVLVGDGEENIAEGTPCIVMTYSVTPIRNYWKFGG
jgi:hypothetical protein